MGIASVSVKRVVSFRESETEVTDLGIGAVSSTNEQISAGSSNVDSVDTNGKMTSGVAEKAENILLNHESGGDKQLDGANESIEPEFATHIEGADNLVVIGDMAPEASCSEKQQSSVVDFEEVSGNPVASSSESEQIEDLPVDKEVSVEIKQDQVHSSGPDANFREGIDQEANEELSSPDSECEEKPIYELEKQLPVSDKAMVESSSENHEGLGVSL